MTQQTNVIHCGDNLEIMNKYVSNDSIDLIYMDPPYFSQRDYGDFDDTFDDIEAYLQWLRPRLEQCKRVLSDTGSIYVHLDWHAVHYVKQIMDEIFGMKNFQNDISWCYNAPVNSQKRFCRKHDTILFYTKSDKWFFNPDSVRIPYGDWAKGKTSYKTKSFGLTEAVDVELNTNGRLCPDYWDIPILGSSAKERLGYPTQKPEALLERIIKASSNPGDVVLDPFCGCGTAISVARKLGRRWIGIDENVKAIELSRKRLNGGLNGYK